MAAALYGRDGVVGANPLSVIAPTPSSSYAVASVGRPKAVAKAHNARLPPSSG